MMVQSKPDSKPAYCVEDLFVTNRTKYPTIAERFPGVPSGVALGKVLWDIYVKHTLPKAPLVTSGEFNFKRHFLNRRGDEAAIESRTKSVEEVGLLLNIRRGPWVIEVSPGKYRVLHWASILEGVERAWLKLQNKDNRSVQHSIDAGVLDLTVFYPNTPDDVAEALVDMGNALNTEATGDTILQIYRSCPNLETGCLRRKDTMGWTISLIGQGNMEQKKLTYASSVHKNRWSTNASLEKTIQFYNGMNGLVLLSGRNAWDTLVDVCQKEMDFMHPAMSSHDWVINNWHLIFKKLKGVHPEHILKVCMLCVPTLRAKGQCPLLPKGLDFSKLKHLTPVHLDRLLERMTESAAVAQVASAQAQATVASAPSSASGVPLEAPSTAADPDFVDNVDVLKKYLTKIYPTCPTLDAYEDVTLYAGLLACIDIPDSKTKGGSKILTKYSALRKMIKTQVYRFAKLQPRVSDVDFAKDEGVGPYGGNGESDERILARFHERVELAEELSTFLINADVTKSPRCQNMYAVMLNRATMNVIMQVGTGGSVDQAFDAVILKRG